jgi:hypothetical protein
MHRMESINRQHHQYQTIRKKRSIRKTSHFNLWAVENKKMTSAI